MLPATSSAASQYFQVSPQYYQQPLQNPPPGLQVNAGAAPPHTLQLLPTMFSQPYAQPYAAVATQPPALQPPNQMYKTDMTQHSQNARQTLYSSYQAPDLPGGAAPTSDLRISPHTLGMQNAPQNAPPHALLPRMLAVQQVQHPYLIQGADYYAAAPQPAGAYQQPELHYHVQPPIISYYQQNPNGQNVAIGVGNGGSSNGSNALAQYLQLLHQGAQSGALQQQHQQQQLQQQQQQSMYAASAGNPGGVAVSGAAAAAAAAAAANGTSSGVSTNGVPGVLQGLLHGTVQLNAMLAQLQYPMSGQIGGMPSTMLVVHQVPPSGLLPMTQGSYTLSPTLKMTTGPYGNKMYESTPDSAGRQYGTVPYTMDQNAPKLGQGVKKNQCPVCQKLFKRPSSLQIHFYIHTGVKLYKCEWEGCGRLFNVKSNMTRHYKLHLKSEKG